MKGKVFAVVALALLGIATAACSQPTTPSTTTSSTTSTSASTPAHAVGPIRSTGVVTQVDAAAGTITINHQTIDAISWPAMTMQFHAENPAILQGIAVGDHVSFELKSASEPQVVIAAHKE